MPNVPNIKSVDVTQMKTPEGRSANLLTLSETAIVWTDDADDQFKFDVISPPNQTIDLDVLGGIIDTLVSVGKGLKKLFGGCDGVLVPDQTITFGADGKISKIEQTMKCVPN